MIGVGCSRLPPAKRMHTASSAVGRKFWIVILITAAGNDKIRSETQVTREVKMVALPQMILLLALLPMLAIVLLFDARQTGAI